jgi:hypothetical protein
MGRRVRRRSARLTAAQVLLSPAVGSGVASGAGASRASAILHDRQTRSMLQTEQHLPRLGSQSGTVEADPDGSTDIYFGPTAPEGKANNLAPDRPREKVVDDPAAL